MPRNVQDLLQARLAKRGCGVLMLLAPWGPTATLCPENQTVLSKPNKKQQNPAAFSFPQEGGLHQVRIWCLQGFSLPSPGRVGQGSCGAQGRRLPSCPPAGRAVHHLCVSCGSALPPGSASCLAKCPICALLLGKVTGLLEGFLTKLHTSGIFCLRLGRSWGWRWLAARLLLKQTYHFFFPLLPEHFL